MRAFVTALRVTLCLLMTLGAITHYRQAVAATGDLTVFIWSDAAFSGVAPGETATLLIQYWWEGDGPAPDVVITATYPSGLFTPAAFDPQPSSHVGNQLTWNLGTLNVNQFGMLQFSGTVPESVEIGSELVFTASIAGNVTDEDEENNTDSIELSVQPPAPDLWVWKWGLLEELEQGLFFVAEQDVPTTFNIFYFNWSRYEAQNVVLVDELPQGVELISAVPEPSSVAGSTVTWNLGTLEEFASGEIVVRVRPREVGSLSNTVTIATTSDEVEVSNNSSTFSFQVVSLLPPRLLKPNVVAGATENPVIVGRNTVFQGLARAGATVTLYEGSADGCIFDFSFCNPVELATTTAGTDRRFSISNVLTEARDYYLYLKATKDDAESSPAFSFYLPYAVRIDENLDRAGFDLDNFTVQTENQTARPGALGGTSGMTPNEPWSLNIRQQAPDAVTTSPDLQEYHKLRLEIYGGSGHTTQEVPVGEIEKVSDPEPSENYPTWDFKYEHQGFEAGSRVEIWCLPVYYTEEGIPLVGLVYVKCHEMLIDPAGYVYDLEVAGSEYEWPEVPPSEALITDATVVALQRVGDDDWVRWAAEETGQVNPQVTDDVTEDRIKEPGYYAFYVPPGQYQVSATAQGYADYVSPILTVVDAPVFHNVGMRVSAAKSTGIEKKPDAGGRDALPTAVLLHQNYPNPFNPSTTISYALVAPAEVTLTVHNLLGQEVARLVQEVQEPGVHHVRFDAGDLTSGVYFYRVKAGGAVAVRKMTLVR